MFLLKNKCFLREVWLRGQSEAGIGTFVLLKWNTFAFSEEEESCWIHEIETWF